MSFTKQIVFFGSMSVISCDGKCNKAWGIGGRPKKFFSKPASGDLDDYVFVADSKLGTAPEPGKTRTISEGSDMKPSATGITDAEQMNRWCTRECERSVLVPLGRPFAIPDLEHPLPNNKSRHPQPSLSLK